MTTPMTKDNFVDADNLMYEIYTLLMNNDKPLSDRDKWFASELCKLGCRVINRYTTDEIKSAISLGNIKESNG